MPSQAADLPRLRRSTAQLHCGQGDLSVASKRQALGREGTRDRLTPRKAGELTMLLTAPCCWQHFEPTRSGIPMSMTPEESVSPNGERVSDARAD
jgi:hypothetical protein